VRSRCCRRLRRSGRGIVSLRGGLKDYLTRRSASGGRRRSAALPGYSKIETNFNQVGQWSMFVCWCVANDELRLRRCPLLLQHRADDGRSWHYKSPPASASPCAWPESLRFPADSSQCHFLAVDPASTHLFATTPLAFSICVQSSMPQFHPGPEQGKTCHRRGRLTLVDRRWSATISRHWLTGDKGSLQRAVSSMLSPRPIGLREQDREQQRKPRTRKLRLPGKLADCSSSASIGNRDLPGQGDFRAGGSAKARRQKKKNTARRKAICPFSVAKDP